MILLGTGETAEVYKINDYVVKLFFKGASHQEIDREYDAVKQIGSQIPFAPRVYDKIKIEDRYGYEMEEITGELYLKVIDKEPELLDFHGRLLGSSHRNLHEFDVKEIKLISLRTNMLAYFDHLTVFNKEIINWAKEIIKSLPEGRSILHGDYMPYNLMYKHKQLYAMDWCDVMIGHGDADVARTLHFIICAYDHEEALYTIKQKEFVKSYLNGYYDNEIPYETLHKWLLVNAMIEYDLSVKENELNNYVVELKDFIESNYRAMYSKWLFDRE